jgi:hypothetical protein
VFVRGDSVTFSSCSFVKNAAVGTDKGGGGGGASITWWTAEDGGERVGWVREGSWMRDGEV